MIISSGAEATTRFFDELNTQISETPEEKETRQKQARAAAVERWQHKLQQLKGMAGKTLEVPIILVELSENIRENIDQQSPEFRALVDSVGSLGGVLQAPVVAVLEREGLLRLICLAGHRRLLALKAAGAERASVRVLDIKDERQHLLAALAENVLREDLHPLDVAKTLSRLKHLGNSLSELAEKTGKNAKTVGHLVKMQDDWPEKARELIRKHPHRFNTRALLTLARQKLTPEEVLRKISERVDGKLITPPQKFETKKFCLQKQVLAYCQQEKLSDKEQGLLMKALKDLGLLSATPA